MKILNKRHTKRLFNQIQEQYSLDKIKIEDYLHTIKKDFYLISKDIEKVNLNKLNVKSAGLYFGTIKNEKFIPSREAIEILGLPEAL